MRSNIEIFAIHIFSCFEFPFCVYLGTQGLMKRKRASPDCTCIHNWLFVFLKENSDLITSSWHQKAKQRIYESCFHPFKVLQGVIFFKVKFYYNAIFLYVLITKKNSRKTLASKKKHNKKIIKKILDSLNKSLCNHLTNRYLKILHFDEIF